MDPALTAVVRRALTTAVWMRQLYLVNPNESHPLSRTLRWLTLHARFPTSRLAKGAEVLVLFAAAAQADEAGGAGRVDFTVKSRDIARDAALRAHSERRKLAHFKCDNSAKV